MPVELDVRVQMNDAARKFPQLRHKIPVWAAQELNKLAVSVRSRAIKETASDLKLPQSIVRYRIDLNGQKKGDRIRLTKANRSYLVARLITHARGIPLSSVAGLQTRPRGGGGGVKAKGGRFYQGAFKQKGLGFKRTTKERFPLMVPKIGVREKIDGIMQRSFSGWARAEFRQRMERRMVAEMARA